MRLDGWKLGRTLSLLLYWLVVVVLIYRNYLQDPPNPALTGTARYGRNVAGEFEQNITWAVIELVVLYLVLRPWSYRRSWGRSLAALILLFPWTCLLLINIHVGGTTSIHGLGLLLLEAGLFCLTLVSGFQAIRNSYRPHET